MENFLSSSLLDTIADELAESGFAVLDNELPTALTSQLYDEARKDVQAYKQAGIGRGGDHQIDQRVRGDQIRWMDGSRPAERLWLEAMETLKEGLNQRLFMGLFEYESHYAHYAPGAFYERHVDAFKGQSNRILSTVTYLNPSWQSEWGGEFVLYQPESNRELARERPEQGKLVIFMSEGMPHEVLMAAQDRYSIAGWFRARPVAGI